MHGIDAVRVEFDPEAPAADVDHDYAILYLVAHRREQAKYNERDGAIVRALDASIALLKRERDAAASKNPGQTCPHCGKFPRVAMVKRYDGDPKQDVSGVWRDEHICDPLDVAALARSR